MAPLDTGNVINLKLVDPLDDRAEPSPTDFEKLGGYLQAVRRHRNVSLDDLAEKTRISRAYLRAIEDGETSALPSRPFAIGYVRSYAQALGLDGEAAVARFKQEAPDLSGPLRNPIGVQHEDSRRNPLIFVAAGLVVAGVISWNVVQRAAAPPPAPFSTLSGAQAAEPQLPKGPIALGAATAPPADQTMPTPYVTPGLDAAVVPGAKPGQSNAPTPTVYAAPATFTPKGEVYGAAATAPHVVLQATKAASLIVRGAGGAVYFARQLQPGEAYRAPVGEGLSLDISDPAAFNLYMSGQLQGTMAANLVTIDKLVAKTPPAAPVATASVSPTVRPATVTPPPQPAKTVAPAA